MIVRTRLNGEIRQQASTAEMVFGVATLIEYVTAFMTLLPGDVLLTGTPEGVGKLADGDVVEVEVEGVGVLRNVVRVMSGPVPLRAGSLRLDPRRERQERAVLVARTPVTTRASSCSASRTRTRAG